MDKCCAEPPSHDTLPMYIYFLILLAIVSAMGTLMWCIARKHLNMSMVSRIRLQGNIQSTVSTTVENQEPA